MGFRVLERVAGQDEVRGSHGNRDNAELVQGRGEQAGTETFAKGGQPVQESRIDGHRPALRRFMKQIAGEKLQFVLDLRMVLFGKLQAIEDAEVEPDEILRGFMRFSELV